MRSVGSKRSSNLHNLYHSSTGEHLTLGAMGVRRTGQTLFRCSNLICPVRRTLVAQKLAPKVRCAPSTGEGKGDRRSLLVV